MKTIVHVIDTIGFGGAEILLAKTIPLLKEYKNIICLLREPVDLLPELRGFPIYNLGFKKKSDFFKAINNLKKIIIENNAVIVHSHLLWSTWIARMACPKNVQLIFTIHNLLSKDAFNVNKASLFMEKLTYNKKQVAIGVSNEVLNDYEKYIGIKGQKYLVYNFIEDSFFEKKYFPRKALNGSLNLVAVGNLRRQKNYKKLLQAFVYLKDFDIRLDVFGAGNLEGADNLEEELKLFVNRNNLKVRLRGRATNIADLLTEYDVFVMSSIFEGFSVSLVEAMATGLPVILSDIEVLKEAAEDKALYFNPESPQSIADSILKVFNKWDEFRENSLENSKFIMHKASKEQYLQKLNKIYSQYV